MNNKKMLSRSVGMRDINALFPSPLVGEGARRAGEGCRFGFTLKRDAESSLLSISTAEKTQGRDPEQKPFGMALCKGFTLIEILVVVLIIGILAAIAIPQYQKVVEKTRWIEWFTVVNGLAKETQLAFLIESFPASGDDAYDICRNFESFSGGDWSNNEYKTTNFWYSIEDCRSNLIYIDTRRINAGGWGANIEVRFYPNKPLQITYISPADHTKQKFFCDLITNALGKTIVDDGAAAQCAEDE